MGRAGARDSSVGPDGRLSHRFANRLVGNHDADAALGRSRMVGPELEAGVAVTCAVAGARFGVTVNGVAFHPMRRSTCLHAGGCDSAKHRGVRAPPGDRGGVDVPASYGSRATSLTSGWDPSADVRCEPATVAGRPPPGVERTMGPGAPALPPGGARLRVLDGPHAHMFPRGSRRAVCIPVVVSTSSNRMGYRLSGPSEHARVRTFCRPQRPWGRSRCLRRDSRSS